MIQGDGMFAVKNGNETMYTRAGSFSFDTQALWSRSVARR